MNYTAIFAGDDVTRPALSFWISSHKPVPVSLYDCSHHLTVRAKPYDHMPEKLLKETLTWYLQKSPSDRNSYNIYSVSKAVLNRHTAAR